MGDIDVENPEQLSGRINRRHESEQSPATNRMPNITAILLSVCLLLLDMSRNAAFVRGKRTIGGSPTPVRSYRLPTIRGLLSHTESSASTC